MSGSTNFLTLTACPALLELPSLVALLPLSYIDIDAVTKCVMYTYKPTTYNLHPTCTQASNSSLILSYSRLERQFSRRGIRCASRRVASPRVVSTRCAHMCRSPRSYKEKRRGASGVKDEVRNLIFNLLYLHYVLFRGHEPHP